MILNLHCGNLSDQNSMECTKTITKGVSKLLVKKLNDNAVLPKKGSPGAAGYDLFAAEPTVIPPNNKGKVLTGLQWKLPSDTYGRIAPRSGLAWKNSINVMAGVIDQDYRGQIMVILFNHGEKPFKIEMHDRIAQLIVEKIEPTELMEVEDLDATLRGEKGFGSTGVSISKQNHDSNMKLSHKRLNPQEEKKVE